MTSGTGPKGAGAPPVSQWWTGRVLDQLYRRPHPVRAGSFVRDQFWRDRDLSGRDDLHIRIPRAELASLTRLSGSKYDFLYGVCEEVGGQTRQQLDLRLPELAVLQRVNFEALEGAARGRFVGLVRQHGVRATSGLLDMRSLEHWYRQCCNVAGGGGSAGGRGMEGRGGPVLSALFGGTFAGMEAGNRAAAVGGGDLMALMLRLSLARDPYPFSPR